MLLAVLPSQDCKTQPESVPSGSPHPKFYLVFDLGLAGCHPGFHREPVSVWVPVPLPAASPVYPPGFPPLSPRPNPPMVARMENWQERAGEGSFCMWKRRLSYLSQGRFALISATSLQCLPRAGFRVPTLPSASTLRRHRRGQAEKASVVLMTFNSPIGGSGGDPGLACG